MGAYRGSKSPSGPRVVPHVSHGSGAPGGYYSSYGQNLVVSLPPSYSTGGSRGSGGRTVTVSTGSSSSRAGAGASAYQHGGSANRPAYSGQHGIREEKKNMRLACV